MELITLRRLKLIRACGPYLSSVFRGSGIIIVLFKLSRKYLPLISSLLAVLLFCSLPLVSWLSGSAYIDLPRTLFELLALYFLLNKNIVVSAVAIGLAVSTKTLAMGSVAVLTLLNYYLYHDLRKVFWFCVVVVFVAVPWFLSAYLNTGYPLYPIGNSLLDANHSLLPQLIHPWRVVTDLWSVFIYPQDFLHPIFILILPWTILQIRRFPSNFRPIILYTLFGYFAWYFTPRTGGGRFLLPYLPAWSLLTVMTIYLLHNKIIKTVLVSSLILICVLNITSRVWANKKIIPYVLGKESDTAYLCGNLDPAVGTFIDCSGMLNVLIPDSSLTYVAGVHNLYYIDFPFVDETWYRGEDFNYVLAQQINLDVLLTNKNLATARIRNYRWKLIYTDRVNKIYLYKKI